MIENIKKSLEENLRTCLKQDTQDSLGDRSQYIGASDISGCLRKSYLSKIQPVEHSAKQLIVFEGGHLVENIAKKMLSGFTIKEQVEIKSAKASNGFPIKPHLDFVIYDKKAKTCTVVEVKSSEQMDEPYESYILQVQFQMDLLQKQCGSGWKVDGMILVINPMSGWYDIFEAKPNKVLADMAMDRANQLAKALQFNEEPVAEEQLYCSSCGYKSNCPAIAQNAETLPDDVKLVASKLLGHRQAEKEIKSLKKQLTEFFEATGKTRGKIDNTIMSLVKIKGKDGVDTSRLKQEEPEIYNRYYKQQNGYSFVKII
jgi:CRISPR-associated exonuclease Cas4